MSPSALRRTSRTGLAVLLVLAALTLTSPARGAEPPRVDPAPNDVSPAEPLLQASRRGQAALRRLGDDLDVAAARNDLRAGELRTLLRTDETAWVDPRGQVFYVDPAAEAAPVAPAAAPAPAAPLSETFELHSNPGASRTILLDFDGALVSGTWWNAGPDGVLPAVQPAWDPEGDGPAFSDGERASVQQVWAMVAEDYAPFDVDVTTEDPGEAGLLRSSTGDSVYGTRVLVTPSDDAWTKLCAGLCGGVAYVDVFDLVGPAAQPAWVFPEGVGNDAKGVAEAASHEAGHNLGLEHDALPEQDYYDGHGVWAPIMGVGYGRPVVQWSRGSYPGANNQQDDLGILTGYLGSRQDEASGFTNTPSALPTGEALIGTSDDVDAYLLGSCAAGAVVEVSPAATAPNLDVRAVLYDATGAPRSVSEPPSTYGDGTTATGLDGTLTVPTGGDGWVVTVDGVGEGAWGSGGYDDYGSLGRYTVSAPGCDGPVAAGLPTAPGAVTTDTPGPTSLTLRWNAPTGTGDGPVTGYVVSRSGSTASQALPATARSHTFTGLAPSTSYQLSVRAVNATGAGPVASVSATTLPPAPAAPSVPRDVTGSYVQDADTLLLQWTEPASTGSQPISGYAVYFDGRLLRQVSADAGGVQLGMSGFADGEYVLGVAAVNAVGMSPRVSRTITVERPATAPSAPTGVGAAVRGRRATVTWGAAAPNGSAVTRYLVDVSKGRDRSAEGSTRKVVLRGLAPGRYRVRVAAQNAVGTSSYSGWRRFRVRG